MALLGVLDALRDADGGADSATDEAGRRFNALRRGRALRRARGGGVDPHGPRGEELAWALQCDTQEALLASALDDSSGTGYGTGFRGWARLRLLGAPLWLRDDDALRALVDGAARAEFAATRDPAGENPCALLFVSLGRVGVLAGLFRAVRDARLAEFFSRDFAEARHREAALKNAYALLSKHRYLFAATFFALAGQPADAAALVWKHGGDLSLAVTVARLAPAAKKDAEEPNPTRTRTDSSRDPGAKIGGDAGDDGTISMDAFANFGARKTTPETTPENVSRTSPTPPPEKEPEAEAPLPASPSTPEAEAPLPASLSPAAKTFLRAEVIPSFGVSSDATRGEDAWTLAALRWMCGDGDASVSALASVASDANASSAAAASAADLCAFIAGRRALRATRPTLARAAAAAAAASAGRLVLSRSSPRGCPSPRWSDVADVESTEETKTETMRRRRATSTTVRFVSRGRARARRSRRVSPPPRSLPRRRATFRTFRTFRVRRLISTRPSRRCVVSRPARGSPRRGYAPRSTRREREFELDADFESPSGLAETRRRRRQRRRRLPTPPPDRIRLERRRFSRVARFRVSDDSRSATPSATDSPRAESDPATPSSPPTPNGPFLQQSGFDVLMPGFGPSVLPEKRPAPPATEIRALRSPVEIARLTADAFYGACVNPAVPYQLGLAAVKKGLVVADLRRLGAAGATRAPDGRAVVSASAVLQAAHRPRADASLWASPSGGSRARAPRRGPRNRGARNRGARNRGARASAIGPSPPRAPRLDDWTADAEGAASVSRPERHPTTTAGPSAAPSAGDVVARCVEAHPKQPIMLAGTASGTAVLWRFAPDAAENGRAGVVAAPGSRGGAIGANASTKSRNVETIAGSSNESSSDASSAISAVAWSPGGGRFAIGTAGCGVDVARGRRARTSRDSRGDARADRGDARVGVGIFVAVGGGGGGVETRRRGGFAGAVGYPRAADELPRGRWRRTRGRDGDVRPAGDDARRVAVADVGHRGTIGGSRRARSSHARRRRRRRGGVARGSRRTRPRRRGQIVGGHASAGGASTRGRRRVRARVRV